MNFLILKVCNGLMLICGVMIKYLGDLNECS